MYPYPYPPYPYPHTRRVTRTRVQHYIRPYFTEINSFLAIQDENRSTTMEGTPIGTSLSAGGKSKRVRDEVEELLDQVSRGGAEGEEDEPRAIRRQVREDEMPWYNATVSSS